MERPHGVHTGVAGLEGIHRHAHRLDRPVSDFLAKRQTVDLEVRPVFHWSEDRVRAHVLLCMLSYYVEWHMRQLLAPILFDDHDRAAAESQRTSPVAKAQVSAAARRKAATKTTDDGLPVHSFRSLIADLATLTRNTVRFAKGNTFTMLATPTPVQDRAFALLGLSPTATL